MLISALISFFKYKATRSIVILACWRSIDQIQFVREIFKYGISATFSCEAGALNSPHNHGIQGVIYFQQSDDSVLKKTPVTNEMRMSYKTINALTYTEILRPDHFSIRYAWLVVGEELPAPLGRLRYDADVTLLRPHSTTNHTFAAVWQEPLFLEYIHSHPGEGTSLHPWALWTSPEGLQVLHERERIIKKFDLRGYPMKISAPTGLYSEDRYPGTHTQYMKDEKCLHLDASIRCGYHASELALQFLNATEVVISTELWAATTHNDSMILMVQSGRADIACGILRLLPDRMEMLDYVIPIWPFGVGFTYLAERESNGNMFLEPFTTRVWTSCLLLGAVLAVALRITSRSQEERDGSYFSALATFLQQDASAVPAGVAGRWTFMVVSVFAMLVNAYYTSAIVSALMSAGIGGPETLQALADSKYAIASEDYNYMRFLFFDVKTNWPDLEYLKRKKQTSKLYQDMERGVELLAAGGTAFHSEYNQLYHQLASFSDDQTCKIKHIDTIPEVITWVTATKHGQYSNIFRAGGSWLHETRLRAKKPPCRAQLLAERVKFGDVAPLTMLSVFGAMLSIFVLGLEIIAAKYIKRERSRLVDDSVVTELDNVDD